MKKTTIATLSFLFLLGASSFASADPRSGYGSYGDDYTVYESQRTVTHYGNYCPDETYSHSYDRRRYRSQRQTHSTNIYVEKNVYNYGAPRETHRQTYRTYNPQPTHYPPAQSYSSYNNGYGGYGGNNVVGDTLIGGAFGAAAGAAIGAAVGNPGQGAALGAAIGGFNGISRGIFGRGFLW